MMELERACETAAHWSREQYARMFATGEGRSAGRLALILKGDSGIDGFLVAHTQLAEWELENIVVASAARRNGLGARLLGELLRRARENDCLGVFLEVRESNQAARGLYQKLGFQETGRRKGYYVSPCEDAILYRWTAHSIGFSL
jgi:ribosomal-protein-alanine N-acetyltransferase